MPVLRPVLIIILLLLGIGMCNAQDQKTADSLKAVYWADRSNIREPELLLNIAATEPRPDSMLKYSALLIENSLARSDFKMALEGYILEATAHRYKGDYEQALRATFKGMDYAERTDFEEGVARANVEIGNIFSENKNPVNAATYYSRGVQGLRRSEDTLMLGRALLNAGDMYIEIGKLDSALIYTKEAADIFREKNFLLGEAYAAGNLGVIYVKTDREEIAEDNLLEAISVLEKLGDNAAVSAYLGHLADLNFRRDSIERAFDYADKSLDLAREFALKEEIADAHLKLSRLHEKAGEMEESYGHFKEYVVYRDSLRNLEAYRSIANERANFEISRKQAEVDLLNQQKRNQQTIVLATAIAGILLLLLALGLYRRNKYIGRTKAIIEREKNRSEHLLLNILPQETAMELKENGKVRPKRFEEVTVLFTDFENFTHYAENLSPEELVKSVDYYFSEFDEIVERHKLEKIKTVGDAYMCASGVPFPAEDHAVRIVNAACDIMEFVTKSKQQVSQTETRFDLRIGINSGPVVAGVVGNKKFAYDIWGDTVNIASRMETTSETGRINISEHTYELVQDHFNCEYRGEVAVKNKGMMKMYFVLGKKNTKDQPQNTSAVKSSD